ncbi:hypothetical protein [Nonomuraea sp. SYSU D8015]|uniref:hypothetical protein n=1 Tax=Nonomuraea sp. SYSU D8015 TaxID=2593644 RepID=UPI00166146AC|nr:hypothetical protein [Nonomuraea sp. SYSU D8015]
MEELPDYEGPVEGDHLLDVLVSRHRFPSGAEHGGGLLIRDIKEEHWADPQIRQQIIQQIDARTAEGLGNHFYDSKNTFQEDAGKCWKEHNRTKNCGDYMSDRKRLLPDTRAERKEAGLDYKNRPNTFLCNFCPYHQIVEQRRNKAKYYDYNE